MTGNDANVQPLADRIAHVRQLLREADGVLIGGGAGLSTAAGLVYDGEDFQREFRPWINHYGITGLYSSGFYPFPTEEEYWKCSCYRGSWVNNLEEMDLCLFLVTQR